MKARFGTIEVEGEPAEIAALIRSLQPDLGEPAAGGSVADNGAGKTFVSEEVAFRVLKRRPLSREQTLILALLKNNHPAWTSAFELQKAAKYNGSQLAGLLGAFGKRIASTEGYKPGTWFFDQEWDYEQDCNRYRLPQSALAAVQRAGI